MKKSNHTPLSVEVWSKKNFNTDRNYKFGKQHCWHGPEIMDKYVVTWRENPELYRPE